MNKYKLAIILAFLTTIFISVGQIFWKFGADNLPDMSGAFIPVVIGLFCYGSGSLLFLWSLKYLDLSYAYPIIALSYVWVSFLSPLFFNDYMAFEKWIGIFLIVIGISFMGFGGRSK